MSRTFSRARFKRIARRLASPVTGTALRRALYEVIGEGCETLYVHSGLSSLGHMVGGPAVALQTLADACDNLFLPTHSYSYPTAPGEPGPVFDAMATPSQMGLLAEAFRKQPDVVRSIHASHSLAGLGRLAQETCAGHYECETPCGQGTPYSRLVHRGAGALMLGVSFRYYTPFHTAEWESASDFAAEPGEIDRLRFIDETGQVRERLSKHQNRTVPRFHEAGEMLERLGFVRRKPLGLSALLFVPDMSRVHEFLVGRLKVHPDFLRSCSTVELE